MDKFKVDSKLQENYEHYYKDGDSKWRWLGALDKAENIQNLCSDLAISSAIEIGAGEGSILKRLSELNFADKLYALDISPSGVETIKKKNIPQLQGCAQFDGYNIPYDNKQFDLAILSHVIEHVEYPRQLLYEAKRVARYVFVEVPLEDTLRLPKDFAFDKVGHINFYSPKLIRRLLQTCGLNIINQQTTNRSKDVYIYQNGRAGAINFYTKNFLLKYVPQIATKLFTYHGAIVCESDNSLELHATLVSSKKAVE